MGQDHSRVTSSKTAVMPSFQRTWGVHRVRLAHDGNEKDGNVHLLRTYSVLSRCWSRYMLCHLILTAALWEEENCEPHLAGGEAEVFKRLSDFQYHTVRMGLQFDQSLSEKLASAPPQAVPVSFIKAVCGSGQLRQECRAAIGYLCHVPSRYLNHVRDVVFPSFTVHMPSREDFSEISFLLKVLTLYMYFPFKYSPENLGTLRHLYLNLK